jgi:hypothetical protein
MMALILALGSLGYGAGYEGFSDGQLYIGLYTPSAEYGWVVTEREIYLDTVFEKRA